MPPFLRLVPLPRQLTELSKPVAIGVGLVAQLPGLAITLGTRAVVTGYGLVTSLVSHDSEDPDDEPFPSYQELDTSAWGAADADAEVVQLLDEAEPPITVEAGLAAAVQDRATEPATAPARQELPIDGYDGLSATALRARVSGLSRGELETLRDYEAGHAKRVTVLALLERQLAKA
jgi:hypothetical protein